MPVPDELSDRPEVTFLHGRDLSELLDAERRATRAALLSAGVPVVDVRISQVDEASVGGMLMLFEAACALAGTVMGINPFDQPGVEAGKRMALGLLGRDGYEQDAENVLSREAMAESVVP
jgi:glucose-6-phosphate isomerase